MYFSVFIFFCSRFLFFFSPFFRSPSFFCGLPYSCVNLGCQQDFVVKENTPFSCRYHAKNPVFHDVGKYWACCPNQVCFSNK